ncbi:MAG: hypothetical protein ACRDA5_06530, partial [Clostridium sp.]
KLFIETEIKENCFDDLEQKLYYACIEATECIFTASEIVAEKKYKDYILLVDTYIELADLLVYRYGKKHIGNKEFIDVLRTSLSQVNTYNGAYMATDLQEARIKTYLNSYAWVIDEENSLAVELDIDFLTFDKKYITA